MKKFLAFILALCLTAGVLAGCGKEEDVVIENDTAVIGTWAEDYFDSGFIFNEDLTGTDTFWDLTFTYTAQEGVLILTYDDEIWGSTEYTYVINGDYLTMTRVSEEESGEDITSYTYTKVAEEETEAADDETDENDGTDESGDSGEDTGSDDSSDSDEDSSADDSSDSDEDGSADEDE